MRINVVWMQALPVVPSAAPASLRAIAWGSIVERGFDAEAQRHREQDLRSQRLCVEGRR
jgi:hypothetical protein